MTNLIGREPSATCIAKVVWRGRNYRIHLAKRRHDLHAVTQKKTAITDDDFPSNSAHSAAPAASKMSAEAVACEFQ